MGEILGELMAYGLLSFLSFIVFMKLFGAIILETWKNKNKVIIMEEQEEKQESEKII